MTGYYIGAGLFLALLGALAWAYRKGRKEARQETALEAAERIAKAQQTRRTIEDEVEADLDLAARARRIGLQRPGAE